MKNLNIKDIAEIAGVGVSTVSRVLNDHPDVKEATRQRVLDIMDEYNYIPNKSARNLKRSTSNNIGIMVKGIYNPFFSLMIQTIEERIAEEGYSMVLHYNDENANDFDAAVELIKEKKLSGLICLGGDYDDLDEEILKSLETPLVLSSTNVVENVDKSLFSSVIIKNKHAAFKAVDYLCKSGHKEIAIICTGERDKSVGKLRVEGYKRALDTNGIPFNQDYVEIGEYTFQTGYEAMNRLLEKGVNMSAVFVTSDIMAIGAAKALLERGVRIPEDISIIGFDGIDYAEYFHPSITTVVQPVEKMGEQSIDILFDLIDKKSNNQHIVLETDLQVRQSCRSMD